MAVINDPNTAANIVAVGEKATSSTGAAHIVQKPIPTSIGHYRTSVVIAMAVTQAANSRLFEVRNTGTNLIIPTRIRVGFVPAGTITTAYVFTLGLFKVTSFNAVDTVNTVTPTTSVKRTTGMTAYPGNANVRHVTLAGAAAGMTGWTGTKDANALAQMIVWAASAGASTIPVYQEFEDDQNGTYPLICAQNEGFELENVVVGSGTSNACQVMLDVSWAEVAAY